MDAETRFLAREELHAIENTWDDYARAAFRLAALVTDRLEAADSPLLVNQAATVLALFKPSGVVKTGVSVETLISELDALIGLARGVFDAPRSPNQKPTMREALAFARALDAALPDEARLDMVDDGERLVQRASATCEGCGEKADVPLTEFVGKEGPEAWFEVPTGWWLRSAGMSFLRLRCNECGGKTKP